MRIFKGQPSVKVSVEVQQGTQASVVDAVFDGLKALFGEDDGNGTGQEAANRRTQAPPRRAPCNCTGSRKP